MATEKRLIDANLLFDELLKKQFSEQSMGIMVSFYPQMRSIVAKQPTVDAVEVVHGRWEWLGPNRLIPECMCGTCSNCKARTKYIVNTEICPNCGAKMDLEE